MITSLGEYIMETDTCRDRLAKFCAGNGLDVGFGGCPIVPNAICLDRPPGHESRADNGQSTPTQWVGSASDLSWLRDSTVDFLYSSHVLEDFDDTISVLREWLRVIKPGGNLVLFLPDQVLYVKHCAENNTLPNQAHKHSHFGLPYIRGCLAGIGIPQSAIVHELFPVPNNPYSFDLVVRKP